MITFGHNVIIQCVATMPVRIGNNILTYHTVTPAYFFLVGWDFWNCGHYWPIVPAPGDIGDGDCGKIDGMKIGRGNRSTSKKPAPAPLCPPQIPHV
jgi:hypothetical protein